MITTFELSKKVGLTPSRVRQLAKIMGGMAIKKSNGWLFTDTAEQWIKNRRKHATCKNNKD